MKYTDYRPAVDSPPKASFLDYALEALSISVVLWHSLLILTSWSSLPEQLPRHFDLTGQVTAHGLRWFLVLFVGVSLAIYTFVTVLVWTGAFWKSIFIFWLDRGGVRA